MLDFLLLPAVEGFVLDAVVLVDTGSVDKDGADRSWIDGGC